MKNPCCSCRGPKFGFWQPYQTIRELSPPVTPVPRGNLLCVCVCEGGLLKSLHGYLQAGKILSDIKIKNKHLKKIFNRKERTHMHVTL